MKIRVLHVDDERVRIYHGEDVLVSLNHDEDGWSGIDRVVGVVKELAKRCGWEYEEL